MSFDNLHFYSVSVRITGDKPNAHVKWQTDVQKNKDYHLIYCTSETIANKVKAMLIDLTSIDVKIIKKKIQDWEDIMGEEIEELQSRGINFRRDLDTLYPVIGSPHLFSIRYDKFCIEQ